MENLTNTFIFDYETLGQNTNTCPILCVAYIAIDRARFFKQPYTIKEILSNIKYLKFDVSEQVSKYNKVIEKQSVDWWKKTIGNDKELEKIILKPSKKDISISQMIVEMKRNVDFKNINMVLTRSPVFDFHLSYQIEKISKEKLPWKFWFERDIRSFIEGMLFPNTKYTNDFIPELIYNNPKTMKIKHHPSYDVLLDVLRLQEVFRSYIHE
jgi:hypothetical protein